ncbi:MAG: cytidylate kinase family protein [Nitrospirae bacterium]|nr:cytidylate kinase family protein [Nitrospirota bacterium]
MAILTISREFGSGGREIGQAVASLLNYEYVNKQRLLADLKAVGSEWEKWGRELDEHSPTVWEKYDWSFRGFSALIQSAILDRALGGKAVIMGRGGNFLLRDIPSALRVRVVAPLEKRLERIMMRESVDRDTAKWLAEKTDNERAGFIRSIYGKEWDDPDAYDIVFDTGKRNEEEVIKIIRDNLLEKEESTSGTETLRMRAEAARVKAGLLTNPELFIPTLDVFCDEGGIVLRGVVHSAKEHKAVEEEARRLEKDLPVRCELHYRK